MGSDNLGFNRHSCVKALFSGEIPNSDLQSFVTFAGVNFDPTTLLVRNTQLGTVAVGSPSEGFRKIYDNRGHLGEVNADRELRVSRHAERADKTFIGAHPEALVDRMNGLTVIKFPFIAAPNGRPLFERSLRMRSAQKISAAHALASSLLPALNRLHQAGFVHADLKPENLLRTENGWRVIDFGAAGQIGSTLEGRDGNPLRLYSGGYASTNRLTGEPLLPSDDLFSAAVMIYELIERRLPGSRVAYIIDPEFDFTDSSLRPALRTLIKRPHNLNFESGASVAADLVGELGRLVEQRSTSLPNGIPGTYMELGVSAA